MKDFILNIFITLGCCGLASFLCWKLFNIIKKSAKGMYGETLPVKTFMLYFLPLILSIVLSPISLCFALFFVCVSQISYICKKLTAINAVPLFIFFLFILFVVSIDRLHLLGLIDFEVDGICYNVTSKHTVAVTHNGQISLNFPLNAYSDSVVIPKSVTNGRKVYRVTEIGESAFEGCYDLSSINIPNGVTTIGRSAFEACYRLTSVTLPRSVTWIDRDAFAYSNLRDIYCLAECASAYYYRLGTAFGNLDRLEAMRLHVPAASLKYYSTTGPWSRFGEIVPIDNAEGCVKTSK